MTAKKYVVGITDHMIGRPDLEAEVLGDDVESTSSPARTRRRLTPVVWPGLMR
ncbi:hypothetical protein [Rhizobium sp. ZW T2_16]|uniref:hypothetical protein n=1 Tax=Rhizobium sp. ZW T2_16 TaxID=3378083 RepID=UPI00385249CB